LGNEDRIRELGIRLPLSSPARGSYLPARESSGLLYLSGNGPIREDGSMIRGVVGEDVTLDQAREASRLTAINILGAARSAAESLDAISGVVSVTGYVRATPDFTEHPKVLDACSDLLVEVLGDEGAHARAAVGVSSLPFGIVVEASAILSLR
jgi:enamine deaminase RidA (YjgF/YER057c/UK114 family)